jgi:hypothetical protein
MPGGRRAPSRTWGLAVFVFVAAACTSGEDDGDVADGAERTDSAVSTSAPESAESEGVADARPARYVYPDAPVAPPADDSTNTEAAAAIDRIVESLGNGFFDSGGVTELAATGDARHAWFISDMLGFFGGGEGVQLQEAFEAVTGQSLAGDPELETSTWSSATNHLIAWDTPDYPGYREDKSGIFLLLEDRWEPFFSDDDSEIDWRYVSWGGVRIDDRELGDPNACPEGCIPALDDPATTDAARGDWYPDDRTVFGLVEGGEALAIPLNIAEIHEMFNLTLGGRRLGIPYCTLCGSAQAYHTDTLDGEEVSIDDGPVLRTTGLLSRSNKVMYDLRTSSVFDTFTGAAVSGSLQDEGVVLDETTVVRSTWGAWKLEHPETQIIAEDGGIGRSYNLDPLGGRDDAGPIFPIGDVDDRLDAQELVVGAIAADGTAVAFRSEVATAAFNSGGSVELAGVRLEESGDGLIAVDAESGESLAAHEAFWFAWSQFNPGTLLWEG